MHQALQCHINTAVQRGGHNAPASTVGAERSVALGWGLSDGGTDVARQDLETVSAATTYAGSRQFSPVPGCLCLLIRAQLFSASCLENPARRFHPGLDDILIVTPVETGRLLDDWKTTWRKR